MLLSLYVIIIFIDLILIYILIFMNSQKLWFFTSRMKTFSLSLYLLYVSVATQRSNEPSYRYAEYSFSGVVLLYH